MVDRPRLQASEPPTTPKPKPLATSGTIVRVTDRGFGFLSPEDGGLDVYFHSRELVGIAWNDLREGVRVGFEPVATPRSPLAVNVTPSTLKELAGDADEEGLATDISGAVRAVVENISDTFARLVAKNSRALNELEWRDVERVVAQVFAGLGFKTELTPGSNDGGSDVIVSYYDAGKRYIFRIEIKHWISKRVDNTPVEQFLHVIARKRSSGGLFLATSGFAKSVMENLVEIERSKVRLGTGHKVVSLCRRYARSKEGLWSPSTSLGEFILEDTLEVASASRTATTLRAKRSPRK